jgi:putative nucleotidyltransferase with HDIG domain
MFKTKNRLSPAEVVRQKLNDDQAIMPFPQVVGRLITALKDPKVDSTTLARIIEEDPALTMRLLRMANSPMFGIANVIETVDRAVTMLGKRPLKNVALTFAASQMFSADTTTKEHKESLWCHSIGCAMVGRELASHVDAINPDDAFLAGVFHDIGKLFFIDVVPDEYIELLEGEGVAEGNHGDALCYIERELFDASHEDVGAKLVRSWQLPEKLMIAVGFHHRPGKAIAHGQLAKLIGCANSLAHQKGIGSSPDESIELCQETLDELGITEDMISTMTEKVAEQFQRNCSACSG